MEAQAFILGCLPFHLFTTSSSSAEASSAEPKNNLSSQFLSQKSGRGGFLSQINLPIMPLIPELMVPYAILSTCPIEVGTPESAKVVVPVLIISIQATKVDR